jgi:hypothetical protein
MPDRHALADALMSATSEQLREDAAELIRTERVVRDAVTGVGGKYDGGTNLRLAALAIAVADLCDGFYANAARGQVYIDPDHGNSVKADTVPAALAALVREGAE